jgi:hypothetical protein
LARARDLKEQLKHKMRQGTRGDTPVTPATTVEATAAAARTPAAATAPTAAAAPNDTANAPSGVLLKPSPLMGIVLLFGSILTAAVIGYTLAGFEEAPLASTERVIGEGIWVVYLYLAMALLLLRSETRIDGAYVWFSLLLLLAGAIQASWLLQIHPGQSWSISDIGMRRAYLGLIYHTAVLWFLVGTVLACRLARYPLGAVLCGILIGAVTVELVRAAFGREQLFMLGLTFWTSVGLFPVLALESLSRPLNPWGSERAPGMLSLLISGGRKPTVAGSTASQAA